MQKNKFNNILSERYAFWLYKYRFVVIVISFSIIVLLGLGALNLKLNTSVRIWFEENSSEVKEYDEFKKRFAQDDSLIIAVRSDKGIFNNDFLAVIQRLTKKFWKTKYVMRVDSLTNYAHINVKKNDLYVNDLFEEKIPTKKNLKAFFFQHINQNKNIEKPTGLLNNLLSLIYPYSKEKINYLIECQSNKNCNISKKEMADIIYETLKAKLPLSRTEFKSFFYNYISENNEVINKLLNKFFVTKNKLIEFFTEYFTKDKIEANKFANDLLNNNTIVKQLVLTYISDKNKELSLTMKIWYTLFPQLNKKRSVDHIAERLQDIIDKIPPSKESFIYLITPYIINNNPAKIILNALQTVFPPYYDENKLKNWLKLNNLSNNDKLELITDVFKSILPLTEKELKDFIKHNLMSKDKSKTFNELSKMLFYTKTELINKRELINKEKLIRLYVSEDEKTSFIFLTPKLVDFSQDKSMDFFKRIRDILDDEISRSTYSFYVGGIPEMHAAMIKYIKKDFNLMIPLMVSFILIILFYLFRSFFGMIMPMLIILLSIVGTLGISGFLGFEFDSITAMVPQVLMAICIADSIHILTMYYRELAYGKSKKDAMITAVKLNILPCFLTSITTALGFLSLLTSSTPPIRVLGVMIAVGSLLAFIITITFLPALISVLPHPKIKSRNKKRDKKWILWFGKIVINYRTYIFVSTMVITVVLSFFIIYIQPDNNPVNYFKKGTDFRIAMDYIDKKIKGSYSIEVSIDSKKTDGIKDPVFLNKIETFQRHLESDIFNKTFKKVGDFPFQISHTSSLVDIIKNINQKLHENKSEYYIIPGTKEQIAQDLFLYTSSVAYGRDLNNQINVDQSITRMTIRTPITSSENILKLTNYIKDYSSKYLSDYNVISTGQTAIFASMEITMNMLKGLGIALIIIGIVVTIAFRSIKIGLLSLVPNVIPVIIMFGLVGLIRMPFDAGISMVAAVVLGIVVDDTVHFINRYMKSRVIGKTIAESVNDVFYDVASAMVFTSVILAVGFGIFIFSSFGVNVNFGLLTSIIMVVAIILDLIFFPSVLFLGAKKSELSVKKN